MVQPRQIALFIVAVTSPPLAVSRGPRQRAATAGREPWERLSVRHARGMPGSHCRRPPSPPAAPPPPLLPACPPAPLQVLIARNQLDSLFWLNLLLTLLAWLPGVAHAFW